ncbi:MULTISPECIES: M28 family peptidase [unclassified Bradyrhizobium]|uniref:M28 family peptidase n=1 Tax=unclassified Bradyrhizobium TaxID=2631580 RepID=UPI0028E1F003|nr:MULTISPECIES: M28 family peptidase [unclassified Bradyrhizobium]
MSNKDLETLTAMLTYRRPAGSPTEAEFIERFLMPLGVKKDQFGNHFLIIGEESPTVLWSSHTDSVHNRTGYQKVHYDGKFLRLPEKSKSNCLGADCASGVWIMTEMIKAKVPGLYIFHAAEEIGCIGSSAIAEKNPKFLEGIQVAVAFDRRRTHSVITHQGPRCCSDTFGNSIAAQLPEGYKLDPTGFLTDTKKYINLVPECSNLSVGYFEEHHPTEKQDVDHLIKLRDHMVKIDQSKFVVERDPKKPELPSQILSKLSSYRRKRPSTVYDLVYHNPGPIARFLQDEVGLTFKEVNTIIECQNQKPDIDQGGNLSISDLFDDDDDFGFGLGSKIAS